MLLNIKTKGLRYIAKDIHLDFSNKKVLLLAPNGWGKTQFIKAIRSKLFEDNKRTDIQLDFSDDFKAQPKGVYFILNEELDGRAIKESIDAFDDKTFISRTIEYMDRTELSNGMEQKRTLDQLIGNLALTGTIWFLDEPEKSLDIVELDSLIKKLLDLDIQLFVISHSPLFLREEKFRKYWLDEGYKTKVEKILSRY